MKKLIGKILTYIAVVVAVYGIISFLALELNPIHWGWFGRLVLIIVIFSSLNIVFDNNE